MPDDIAGPGKLRVFSYLLLGVVSLLVIGAALDWAYDFPYLLDVMMYLARNPMLLFELAGILALGALAVKGANMIQEF